MLTKERYKAYHRERNKAKKLLGDTCEVSDTVRGSGSEPPYVQHTIIVRGVDWIRWYRNKKKADELLARCAEVEADIALTPASIRPMLEAKYLEGLTWDQVGERFNASGDACRMRVDRWFDMEKPQP